MSNYELSCLLKLYQGNKKLNLQILKIWPYDIFIDKKNIRIGCKFFTHKQWENFTDEEILKMDHGSLKWWKKYKKAIFSIVETI